MTRWADVKSRGGTLFVSTHSQTVPGFLILDDWMAAVPDTVSDAELGRLVLQALDQSKQNAPAPPPHQRSSAASRKQLKLAGVRSYREFAIGTRGVFVEQEGRGERVQLTPMKNEGPREGLSYLVDRIVESDDASPDVVGRAVRQALGRAL